MIRAGNLKVDFSGKKFEKKVGDWCLILPKKKRNLEIDFWGGEKDNKLSSSFWEEFYKENKRVCLTGVQWKNWKQMKKSFMIKIHNKLKVV